MTFYFNLFYKIWNEYHWFEACKQMNMIGHTMYSQHFSLTGLRKRNDVFVKFFFMYFLYETLPALRSNYKLQIDL